VSLVLLNDEIQAAREVTKSSTLRLETFRSPAVGMLGYADPDGRVAIYRRVRSGGRARDRLRVDGVRRDDDRGWMRLRTRDAAAFSSPCRAAPGAVAYSRGRVSASSG
jgi:hypothetical protein